MTTQCWCGGKLEAEIREHAGAKYEHIECKLCGTVEHIPIK